MLLRHEPQVSAALRGDVRGARQAVGLCHLRRVAQRFWELHDRRHEHARALEKLAGTNREMAVAPDWLAARRDGALRAHADALPWLDGRRGVQGRVLSGLAVPAGAHPPDRAARVVSPPKRPPVQGRGARGAAPAANDREGGARNSRGFAPGLSRAGATQAGAHVADERGRAAGRVRSPRSEAAHERDVPRAHGGQATCVQGLDSGQRHGAVGEAPPKDGGVLALRLHAQRPAGLLPAAQRSRVR